MAKRLSRNKLALLSIIFLITGYFFYSNAAGIMRDITSMQLVADMKVGWDLGNTLDAYSSTATGLNTETCWGNPKTTKSMIDALKAKGFKTIRIPVTWKGHFGSSPSYTIDSTWLNRVQEVVDYAIDDSMYVILNSHHDEWVTLTSSTQTAVTAEIQALWGQIAKRFKDYSDYLVFETLNEPRLYGDATEWTGGTSAARTILNAYNLAIVDTIRGTGGNNALRHIMIPTHGASPLAVAINGLVIPNDDSRVIVSIHDYWPYSFTMDTAASSSTASWGTTSDKTACDSELDRLYNKFIKNGIPVIMGEWGSIYKSNTSTRALHAGYFARALRDRGILPVWWDNGVFTGYGAFGILNRNSSSWYYQEIADSIVSGALSVTSIARGNEFKTPALTVVNHLNVSSGYVSYFFAQSGNVSIKVYDMLGKNIAVILNEYQKSGTYKIKFPALAASYGSYLVEFKANNAIITKKINILTQILH
jgi:endoglucanase